MPAPTLGRVAGRIRDSDIAEVRDRTRIEEVVGDRERTVLRLHPAIAPVKAAVLPLISKDEGMATRARTLFEELRRFHIVEHDDSGQIGRRYRRQDEIGTPFCITVDFDTLEDDAVTIRDRETMAQERVAISQVESYLAGPLLGC